MRAEPAAAVDAALEVLGDIARRDVPIGPMTTYRVGGAAAVFVTLTSLAQLERVGEAVRVSALPVVVLGRGSNLLVADAGFAGIVVSAAAVTDRFEIDVESCIVRAGSSVPLPVLARQCAARGLTGFEWAVGVPGSIGGAVRMNAGGHGSDIAASLVEVTVADLSGARPAGPTVRTAGDLGLRFRGSDLGPADLVLEAVLQLAPGVATASEAEISEVVAWRRANQPGGQNAGSVFVNPVPGEVSAGALIDQVGLRGLRVGSAHVSDKHANFIQADDGGSADDVVALMRLVRERVRAETGHDLRSEIRLLGFGADLSEPPMSGAPTSDGTG
ncbi:MAG: UDP-N-acetylmuramate dehydrogenase [Ilumatobacteraceae bacterium]